MQKYILLGTIVGGIFAFFSAKVVFAFIGVIFPSKYLLLVTVLGIIMGIIIIYGRKNNTSSWYSLLLIALVGIITPFCLIQILFLVFANGDL